MRLPRASGVLLHPTSLPGRHGVGDLGRHAHDFVDFLASTGQRWWQMLPLGPTGYGNSPYQSPSSFAGNPLLIDLDDLVARGWLAAGSLPEGRSFPNDKVDFDAVLVFKEELLRQAAQGWHRLGEDQRFRDFVGANHVWLDDYALYHALKDSHDGLPWYQWEPELVGARTECACDVARAIERRNGVPFVRAVRIRDSVAGASGCVPDARRDALG